jgi:glucose/arabinose dehydrogenase
VLIVLVAAAAAVIGVLTWQQRRDNDDLARRYACPDDEIPPVVMPPGTTAGADVVLTKVAEVDSPVMLAVREGDPSLWVAERPGRVVRLTPPAMTREVAFDFASEVSTAGEQGLLGMAFSPDGGRLYLDYTDLAGDTMVIELTTTAAGIAPASRRDLLRVGQYDDWHNGGHLAFGPDGMLYVALGDGGGQADPDDNGQDVGTLLASILRIDPRPDGDRPYTIPPDNPFVAVDDARPEIWVYGTRNPWRFSFDRATGDLWIGDVGDGCYEEVNVLRPDEGGANLGWDRVEGSWVVDAPEPDDAVGPRFAYRRALPSCAVVGGYVYRGAAIPDLAGRYVFADFCGGWISILPSDGKADPEALAVEAPGVVSLAEGTAGELYVLSLDGLIQRLDPAQ